MQLKDFKIYNSTQPGSICRLAVFSDDLELTLDIDLDTLLALSHGLLGQLIVKGGLGFVSRESLIDAANKIKSNMY